MFPFSKETRARHNSSKSGLAKSHITRALGYCFFPRQSSRARDIGNRSSRLLKPFYASSIKREGGQIRVHDMSSCSGLRWLRQMRQMGGKKISIKIDLTPRVVAPPFCIINFSYAGPRLYRVSLLISVFARLIFPLGNARCMNLSAQNACLFLH